MRSRTVGVRYLIGLALWLGMLPAHHARAEDALRIGTERDDAPFSSFDAHGVPTGFSIDLGDEICRRLKTQCVWVGMRFDALIPALRSGRIDAALSEITVTPARSAQVLFTAPLTQTGGILIVPSLSEITNDPESMRGKTIGVQMGTTHQAYADQVLAKTAGVRLFQKQSEAFDALQAGRIDATLCDMALGHDWLEQHSGSFRFGDRPITDPKRYGSQTAVALPIGHEQMRGRIDAAIKAMQDDGTFTAINRRYFSYSVAPGAFGDPF